MDSFEVNKMLGAVLGTLTFVVGLSIASEIMFEQHAPEKQGYDLPAPVENAPARRAARLPPSSRSLSVSPAPIRPRARLSSSSASPAIRFEKGGPNKVGPNLYGVVGNHHAHLEGFSYSSAHEGQERRAVDVRGDRQLPREPEGCRSRHGDVAIAGIKRPDQRADVIAYLNKNSDSPLPLPAPDAADAAPAEGAAPAGGAPASDAGHGAAPAPARPPLRTDRIVV